MYTPKLLERVSKKLDDLLFVVIILTDISTQHSRYRTAWS